jgi:hypothetical protein
VKAIIRADGTLIVAPESGLEAYALSRWSKENIRSDRYDVRMSPPPNIVVDLSDFPVAAGMSIPVAQP